MSVESKVTYLGELRCEATHGPSGSKIMTDAPADNHGKAEYFSPTDLVGVSIGTCMFTIMGIVAERDGIDIKGATATVNKNMTSTGKRRIAEISIDIQLPKEKSYSEDDIKKLENAAEFCPVKLSLHEDIKIETKFHH